MSEVPATHDQGYAIRPGQPGWHGLEPGEVVCPLCRGIFDRDLHPHDLCPRCYQEHVGDLDYQPHDETEEER